MYRNALKELEDWVRGEKPKPLVIRGARQTGKSYLVQMLAKEHNLELIEVNLEKTKIKELDNRENFTIDKVLSEISVVTKKKISANSLIFLDEIQFQPLAFASLRYFYEDRPGLKVIAAGSLLEVILKKHKISMPVGRIDYYNLGPMTFFEFLIALGEDILLEELQKIDLNSMPFDSLQTRAIELLKQFYFVGGMPEAVKAYRDSKDFMEVRRVQDSLIQTYKDDIPKYADGKMSSTLLNVFNYVPANLGKKVVYSHINQQNTSYIKQAIDLLSLARIIHKTCHNNCSGLPLVAGADCNIFKLYCLDAGIYNALMKLDWEDLYQLSPEELLIKGNIAEQFIAQHLVSLPANEEHLHYWLRNKQKGKAEVDFIVSYKSRIYPIEVKSGSSGKMRSLWQLVYEKNLKTAIRLDLSKRKNIVNDVKHSIQTKDGVQEIECKLICLPLYLIERLYQVNLEN